MNWPLLRLFTWELLKRVDVLTCVVINEGIELAKVYGSTDGHKFVNGVLGKLAPPPARSRSEGTQALIPALEFPMTSSS